MTAPSRPSTEPASAVAGLHSRADHAEGVLRLLCTRLSLPEVVGEDHAWALVGGAVRDCMVRGSPDHYSQALWVPWPDVDVAVASATFDFQQQLASVSRFEFDLRRNSYGGWKARGDVAGEIDLWLANLPYAFASPSDAWLAYLDGVDLSLNAVAFVWPQRRVVVHPRWWEDLACRRIERLALASPRPELLPFRALALMCKLNALKGRPFRLGDSIKSELHRLLSQDDTEALRSALAYSVDKVTAGRWPRRVLREIARVLRKHKAAREAYADLIHTLPRVPHTSGPPRPKRDGAQWTQMRLPDV